MANTNVPTMQELLDAGVHFGHKVARAHPKMKEYIFGARDGVSVLDLAKTEERLKEAAEAAYAFGKSGKVLLVVGTKKQAKEIIEPLAKEAEAPYLTERWIGGTLTNFEEIRKNIKRILGLKTDQEKGNLSHYTKKERLLITRQVEKFEKELGGIADMEKLPDGIFVVDAVSDMTAVKEAYRIGITVFGLSDTNADPSWFNYPVPANDDGIKSIKIICETVLGAYAQGRKQAGVDAKKAADDAVAAEQAAKEEQLNAAVAEEAAVLEEQIEKKILEESERKE